MSLRLWIQRPSLLTSLGASLVSLLKSSWYAYQNKIVLFQFLFANTPYTYIISIRHYFLFLQVVEAYEKLDGLLKLSSPFSSSTSPSLQQAASQGAQSSQNQSRSPNGPLESKLPEAWSALIRVKLAHYRSAQHYFAYLLLINSADTPGKYYSQLPVLFSYFILTSVSANTHTPYTLCP